MAGCDHNLGLVWVGDKIHSAAHAFEDLSRDHVVGQVTVGAYLKSLRKY